MTSAAIPLNSGTTKRNIVIRQLIIGKIVIPFDMEGVIVFNLVEP
jgi:hypothetical protein